ncbi:MBL fold metallo-hydrolase [uncultured Desulfuromusa sp.]|uniref:ribonuclease Z n=1 Tax=uncultured Desulfuromusa sp. TaxID=219183 RepID=UPI002AA6FF3D|nr:MBL fold metallo-hydrolase [uncultured Desulfuromusa sp.]
MKPKFPFRNLIPTFFAGLIDDPLLLIRSRPDGRHLLFDCGQVHHLAKRTFTHLDAIFISHAHMDHWMGIDSVIRQLIASARTVHIFGPPGIAERMEHKLSGYDWNLTEDYWCSFQVHEVHRDTIESSVFPGPQGFHRQTGEVVSRNNRVIYQTPYLQVQAETCDHQIDSLIFRINESPAYAIDRQKLESLDLVPGPWLGELKKRYLSGKVDSTPLEVLTLQNGCASPLMVEDVAELFAQLMISRPQRSIGYISDINFSQENRKTIFQFMAGVDLLFCECTFLTADKVRARASNHLCSEDINLLLEELCPAYFLPMHLSRSYSRRSSELYSELNPPPETQILQIPLQITPRPLLAAEISWQVNFNPEK